MTAWPYLAAGGLFIVAAAATWFQWDRIVKMLITWAASAAWKAIKADRMDPETEARWRDCQKRGGRWDAVKKRCVEPR